jgi:hypothetical protein
METTPTTPRNSTLFIGFGLAALLGAGLAMFWQEHQIKPRSEELLQTREALRLADETLAISRETNLKLQARLAELTVTNQTVLPANPAAPSPAPAPEPALTQVSQPVGWTAAESAHYQAQVSPPAVRQITSGKMERKIFSFAQLPAADGHTLMTSAEYRGAIGNRLMFSSAGAAARTFEYRELHPGVLAHLSLEPAELEAQQTELDEKKTQAEYAAQKAREARAAAEKRYQEALQAARLVQSRIAADRKKAAFEENLRLQALETERMKAEAAMLQAEAAIEKARNPQPVLLFDAKHMGLAPLVNPQTR